eukprot:CAMPEP_0183573686 /NCGR_PEP_ID=MMETSP0371-20130417/131609_1 /TAXON_ID=268820 /ORGANISM="Peridinium aciculiferum, Strain PAER-2" /LENGTH=227 /DNA_ID=CAMNT_0025783689 /DNA_START=12 /DNA_END=695 /DNA_ORIENTATION=+
MSDRQDGLSSGSGLESVESMRQLDAMLADMNASGDDAFHGEPEGLPADSLEGDPGSVLSPQVAADNAAQASAVFETLGSIQLSVTVILLHFSRSPEAFRVALMEGPELQPCRQALTDAAKDAKLESGAKAFVRPEHYDAMCEAIHSTGRKLYTSHVLVAEEFEHLVLDAVDCLPSSEGVRRRDRENLAASWDTLSSELKLRVRRTFIYFHVPSSLYSGTPSFRAGSA